MPTKTKMVGEERAEVEELRRQLAEARESLDAIRRGDVDAVVVHRPEGSQVYTLSGADTPYRIMVEEMQEGAVALNEDGVVVYGNKQIARMLDIPQRGLLGQPFCAFLADESVPLFEALWQRSRMGTSCGEVRLMAAGGVTVPVYLALRVLPVEGPAQTSVVINDLTEQKRHQEIMASEVFAASILDQAHDAIVVCDPAGHVIRVNRAAERLGGGNPLLQPFEAAFPLCRAVAGSRGGSPSDVELSLFPLASKMQFARGVEASLIRPDGLRVELLLSFGQILDSARKPLGTVVTMTDITSRAEAEKALQKSANELARSNRNLEQFATVVSHDLQEPLRTVTGFVQLLEKKYAKQLDADAETFIKYAVDGAKRMSGLINDLLTYARVSTRGQEPAASDAASALRHAIEDLHDNVLATGAKITHDELPTVRADATQLSQVFQNLLSNALKFRGDAPPKIHVSAAREGNFWRFSVSDNGIGVDPQFQGAIFEVFRRLHPRQQFDGSGIGLSICKKIVERHGGRIWVESQPGKGATFHFTLPT
jgi:PAS domain S-box-containing protein